MKKPVQEVEIGSVQEFPKELFAAYDGQGEERYLLTDTRAENLLAEGEPALIARYKLVGVVRATMRKCVKVSSKVVKS